MKNILKALLFTFILYAIFMGGYNYNQYELLDMTSSCADKTAKEVYIGDYYRHSGPTDMKGYYAHAEAFTEMIWAKCFRKGLNE